MKSFLHFLITSSSVVLTLGTFVVPSVAQNSMTIPPMPSNIQAPAGNTAFLTAHAVGTQNYTCIPSASSYIWKGAPQATLFVNVKWMNTEIPQQIATHFLSINPAENGMARPTWQSSMDTSAVWGNPIANSTDSAFVALGSIPWLLLEAVGTKRGPTGGSMLSATTYIQRVNTSGGLAPSLTCSESENLGVTKFVPYEADYIFYMSQKK